MRRYLQVRTQMWAILWTLVWAPVSCVGTATVFAQDVKTLFDFEGRALGADWQGSGRIEASRVELEEAKLPAGDGPGRPAGYGVRLKSPGGGGLFSKGFAMPVDWRATAELEFWVYRSAEEAAARPTSWIDAQLLSPDGKTKFFRKVELAHTGWKKLELPLRYFAWGSATVPRWTGVGRFGLWMRDAGDILVDGIAVEASTDPRAADLRTVDLESLAFPAAAPGTVRRLDTPSRLVLTDAPTFDLDAYQKHLDAVEAALAGDLPFLSPPSVRPVLLVFAQEEAYRRFAPKLAGIFQQVAREPRADGFTARGIATSSWKGTEPRPVFTHEFVHSWLSVRADLDNRGEWLQEGLASRYQLRFHHQDLKPAIAAAMQDPKLRMPLADLANGRPIPLNRYWQTATLTGLLLETDSLRKKLPELFRAVQAAGDTNLAPHLQPVFGLDWPELETQWRAYVDRTVLQ